MILGKSKALLYITHSNLQFYTHHNKTPFVYNFQPDSVKDLEVINLDKLKNQLAEFIKANSLKPKNLIIILSENIYFKKSFSVSGDLKTHELIQNFLDEIPIDSKNSARIDILNKQDKTLIVTNKNLYESILFILVKLNWHAFAVTPYEIFRNLITSVNSQVTANTLTPIQVQTIMSHSDIDDKHNFLKIKELVLPDSEKQQAKPQIKVLLILLILSLVLGAIIIFLTASGKLKLPFFNSTNLAQKTKSISNEEDLALLTNERILPTELPTTSSASTDTVIDKTLLKIQILNGTGISGQAAKVKDLLIPLEYKDFILGNSPIPPQTNTEVSFTENVTPDIQREIITELEKIFTKVISSAKSQNTYDVVIITGQNNGS